MSVYILSKAIKSSYPPDIRRLVHCGATLIEISGSTHYAVPFVGLIIPSGIRATVFCSPRLKVTSTHAYAFIIEAADSVDVNTCETDPPSRTLSIKCSRGPPFIDVSARVPCTPVFCSTGFIPSEAHYILQQ